MTRSPLTRFALTAAIEEQKIKPSEGLKPGGPIVMDDFTPSDAWPPTYKTAIDKMRMAWFEHPQLHAIEVRTEPDRPAVLARLRPF